VVASADSGFLAGLSARFGMTRVYGAPAYARGWRDETSTGAEARLLLLALDAALKRRSSTVVHAVASTAERAVFLRGGMPGAPSAVYAVVLSAV